MQCRSRRSRWPFLALASLLSALAPLAGCTSSHTSTGDRQASDTAEPAAKQPSLQWTTDNVEAIKLNAQAAAYIDRFDKGRKQAITMLRKVIELAPNWLPPRLNLAIALLNEADPEPLAEAEQILNEILQQDPDNIYAHYCLGIILTHHGNFDRAIPHFKRVTELAPDSSFGWYWLGHCYRTSDLQKSAECMQKAVELNPLHLPAIYGLAQTLMQQGKVAEARKLFKRKRLLDQAKQGIQAKIAYDDMGPFANAIGIVDQRSPRPTTTPPIYQPWDSFRVQLAKDTRWVTWDDLQGSDLEALIRSIRQSAGFPWATLDYDRDGDLDVFLAGCVVRGGKVGNLMLRNDGNGTFVDVTEELGLARPATTLAIAVGDYDNDLDPDLYLCNAGPNQLFRNDQGRFSDVTAEAKVDGGSAISTGAVFVDLDLDADLDLFVVNLGDLNQATSILNGPLPQQAPAAVYRNVGRPGLVAPEPKPGSAQKGPVILSTAFEPVTGEGPQWSEPAKAVSFTDLDNDRDVDLIVLTADGRGIALYNDRLFEFHAAELTGLQTELKQPVASLLVLDWNQDDARDLIVSDGTAGAAFLGSGRPPRVDYPVDPLRLQWEPVIETLNIVQPRVVDFDLDATWEVIALKQGQPALMKLNEKGVFSLYERALPAFVGRDGQPRRCSSLITADFTGNGFVELIGFSPGDGLLAYATEGNGSNWVKLWFTGVKDQGLELRTPADGFGVRVIAHAGPWSILTETRPVVGGGCYAYEPLTLGLGPYTELDALRIRWPDNMLQAEVGFAANKTHIVREVRRKSVSCPLLFTWNGRRYEFIADFLGGGGLGYLVAPGLYNEPDPEELLKIEGHQLVADQNSYRIAIAEPMDEVCYLDAVELLVIDHPAGTTVFPDERFAPAGHRASGELLLFERRIAPRHAITHRGHDVTRRLQSWDRDAVDDFRLRATWPGYAEEHAIRLTFDVPRIASDQRLFLCLAGWVEYSFSDTNYAAATAGIQATMPSIELRTSDGKWQTIVPVAGIPAGSPKLMTVELTGKIPTEKTVELRIRTNMQVYWDAAWLGIAATQPAAMHVHRLRPTKATLLYRGHLLEYSPDGRWPVVFDYERTDPAPLVRQFGWYTRYGEVNELLEQTDDAFVIFGAGDAVEIAFDARSAGKPPAGWVRSYVLRTVGFCKSADPLTLHPLTVGPLPFRGMRQYPPAPGTAPANPERVRRLHQKYNTRYHGPPASHR